MDNLVCNLPQWITAFSRRGCSLAPGTWHVTERHSVVRQRRARGAADDADQQAVFRAVPV
jgi:hypothetical protein